MTGHNLPDPRLAFLVFRSRSGSTFFGDRLSRHPQVLVTPESNLAPKLIKFFGSRRAGFPSAPAIADYVLLEPKFRQWNLPRKDLVHALEKNKPHDWSTAFQIICRVYRDHQKPEARVVVFKNSGWYYKNIDLLLSVFPGSKVIGMVRDPRAVYNSARKALHSERGEPLAGSILGNALGWRRYIKILEEAKLSHPGLIYTIKYEIFINDLLNSLNIAWKTLRVSQLSKSNILDIMEKKDDSHLVSKAVAHLHSNVLKAPMPEVAQKWHSELPKWQALLIGYICRHGMRKHGYS
jgi:hypothetical protein